MAASASAPTRVRLRRGAPRAAQLLLVFAVLLLLYGPIVLLGVFSFNDSEIIVLPLRGFTTTWYHQALADGRLRQSLVNSLQIAAIVMPICLVIGTLCAYATTRLRFRLRASVAALVGAALVVPWLVIGISALLFFNQNLPLIGNIQPSLRTIGVMHVVCTFPLVAAIVAARLARFEHQQEEAAIDLGANQTQVLRHIVLPHIAPALAASAIFAFMWSFNNFEISYFDGGADETFPVWAFSTLRHHQDLPIINAISTLVSVVQVMLVAIAWRLLGARRAGVDALGLGAGGGR